MKPIAIDRFAAAFWLAALVACSGGAPTPALAGRAMPNPRQIALIQQRIVQDQIRLQNARTPEQRQQVQSVLAAHQAQLARLSRQQRPDDSEVHAMGWNLGGKPRGGPTKKPRPGHRPRSPVVDKKG